MVISFKHFCYKRCWNQRAARRYTRANTEFDEYEKEFRESGDVEFVKIKEIDNDLFKMPKDYSLAHCVAEDMSMGSGIAVQFRYEFRRVDELLNQRQRTGGLAILRDRDRYIYYLVTKTYSTGKPTYSTLFSSLQKLRQHVTENGITKLAMPRIGCGLDRLQWDNVKFMVDFIFKNVDVEIIVCNLQPTAESPQTRHRSLKLTNETYPIQDIESETIIVYLSSEDGLITNEMTALDEKFNFLHEFRAARKALGNVVFFDKNKDYLLCGCIVKTSKSEPIDFAAFQKCLRKIQKENEKYNFGYIGMQALKDDQDSCLNFKITNILRNAMRNVEVYMCWPGDLINDLLPKDNYNTSTSKSSLDYNRRKTMEPDFTQKRVVWRRDDDDNNKSDRKTHVENDVIRKTLEVTPFIVRQDEFTKEEGKADENWDLEYSDADKTDQRVQEHNSEITTESCYNWDVMDVKKATSHGTLTPGMESLVVHDQQSENNDWFMSDNDQRSNINPSVPVEGGFKDFKKDKKCRKSLSYRTQGKELHSQNPFEKYSRSEDRKIAAGDSETEFDDMHTPKKQKQHHQYESQLAASKGQKIQSQRDYKKPTSVNHAFELYLAEKDELTLETVRSQQQLPKRYSRVCYAREDMTMESDIPRGSSVVQYLGRLLRLEETAGGCAVVKDGNNYIYCLIVASPSTTPISSTIFSAVQKIYEHVMKNGVRKLVIPKKRDDTTFEWTEIEYMFEHLFRHTSIDIIIDSEPQEHNIKSINNSKKIKHVKFPIHEMKRKSMLIYLASEDGIVSDVMRTLERKFDFKEEFNKLRKDVGKVIRYKQDENYVLYGCIVKRRSNDPIIFSALQDCLCFVNEQNANEQFSFAAIQAVESTDKWLNYKIATMVLTFLDDISVFMCWPGKLRQHMP